MSLAALALAACATVTPVDSSATQQRLDVAMRLIAERNLNEGEPALRAVIEEKAFGGLPADARYGALLAAAKAAAARRDLTLEYQYLIRVNAMPQAGYQEGLAQLQAGVRLHEQPDASVVRDWTWFLGRWPEQISRFDQRNIYMVIRASKKLNNESTLPLLQALYGAHWKLKWDFEPSSTWRGLATLLMDKKLTVEAVEVSKHITDPDDFIVMRADRRFDALIAANPAQYDVEAAANRQLRALEFAVQNAPTSLELRRIEIDALRRRQHYGAMLAAADSIVSQVQSTNYPEKLFEDYAENYIWILNDRAEALTRIGRWDDGVAQLEAASSGTEHGAANVSQRLNLGNLYCELGRPQDAMAALSKVGAGVSPYGNMQIQAVRVDAGTQLGDLKQVADSLRFLSANRLEAPFTYQYALIVAAQPDRAAQYLITRLLDSNTRQDALQSVQGYMPTPTTPLGEERDARWHKIMARKDVQAAIAKVGRIEMNRFEEPDLP